MRWHALKVQDETAVKHKPQRIMVSGGVQTWDPSIRSPAQYTATTKLTPKSHEKYHVCLQKDALWRYNCSVLIVLGTHLHTVPRNIILVLGEFEFGISSSKVAPSNHTISQTFNRKGGATK